MTSSAWFPLVLAAALAPTAAQAAEPSSTLFMFELSSGVAEPAYSGGDISLSYGITGGLTFKLKSFPLRFYALTTLIGRNGHGTGGSGGLSFSADRHDVDLYWSLRLVMPVFANFRVYAEGGLGHRWSWVELKRSGDLPPVESRDRGLVGVIAIGAQVRVMENLSLGLRGEMTPSNASSEDAVSGLTGAALTHNRFTLMAQVGFHF
ncbi:MAG: hypothetical protein U1E65_07845 [Myxococcota bacterium]